VKADNDGEHQKENDGGNSEASGARKAEKGIEKAAHGDLLKNGWS
jgi:hypothetical protein